MSDFMNISVAQMTKMAETLKVIARYPEIACDEFISKAYNNIRCSSWKTQDEMCTLDTLRKYGFIEVTRTEHFYEYLYETGYNWNKEKVDMTDEQYEMLPEFFKKNVHKEERKRNYYRINHNKANRFIKINTDIVRFICDCL